MKTPINHLTSNKRRGFLYIAVVGLVLVSVFVYFENTWKQAGTFDATRETTILLKDSRPSGSTSGISLLVTGDIDGEVEVWADNWDPVRLSGHGLDWRIYHDWFYSECELHIRPIRKAPGKLEVKYQFH